MKGRSTAALFLCGAMFGLSYVLVRMTVPTLGPVAVTAIRTLIGGVTLLAIARLRGQIGQARAWRRYLALGALSAAIPSSLISLSMLTLDAGTAAVLNASAPMFALAIDAVSRRYWPTWTQAAGLLTAGTGVVIVAGARGVQLDEIGVLWALCGAAVFAYGGFYAARTFGGAEPLTVAVGQQLAACVLLAPFAIAMPVSPQIGASLVMQMMALGFLGSALAYLLFYWLISVEGPAWTANVNLLVPVFGVLWGWSLLSEPIPLPSIAGMALTVGGLALVLLRSR